MTEEIRFILIIDKEATLINLVSYQLWIFVPAPGRISQWDGYAILATSTQ